MAINKDSNAYTFFFSIILVVVVGTLLTVVAVGLKPFQDANLKMKKQLDMMASVKIKLDAKEDAPAAFKKYVVKSMLLDAEGNVAQIDGKDAVYEGKDLATKNDLAFSLDIKKQYKDWKGGVIDAKDMQYPLFECKMDKGEILYVLPVVGTGLWGPIWGYISIDGADMRTIYAAVFDHKTETPGLGAEINIYERFQKQFEDKKVIADEKGSFKKIVVTKGQGAKGVASAVDGITGGTITSKGVEEMMERSIEIYNKYFKKNRNKS
jgi:Na+-transporting NADH:ubiquinone oxidoreductase subunit C